MKKKLLNLTMLIAIVLVACEKQEVLPNSTDKINSTAKDKTIPNPDQTKISGEPMGDKKWFEKNINGEEGIDYGCVEPGTDCITGVVITPGFATSVEDLSNSSDQGAYVTLHQETLAAHLYDVHLEKIKSNDLNVSLVGEITKTTSGYLLIKNLLGDVVFVHQFRL